MNSQNQMSKQIKNGITITAYDIHPHKRNSRVVSGHHFKDLTPKDGLTINQMVSKYILHKYHGGSINHYYANQSIIEHSPEFQKAYNQKVNAILSLLEITNEVTIVTVYTGTARTSGFLAGEYLREYVRGNQSWIDTKSKILNY